MSGVSDPLCTACGNFHEAIQGACPIAREKERAEHVAAIAKIDALGILRYCEIESYEVKHGGNTASRHYTARLVQDGETVSVGGGPNEQAAMVDAVRCLPRLGGTAWREALMNPRRKQKC